MSILLVCGALPIKTLAESSDENHDSAECIVAYDPASRPVKGENLDRIGEELDYFRKQFLFLKKGLEGFFQAPLCILNLIFHGLALDSF